MVNSSIIVVNRIYPKDDLILNKLKLLIPIVILEEFIHGFSFDGCYINNLNVFL